MCACGFLKLYRCDAVAVVGDGSILWIYMIWIFIRVTSKYLNSLIQLIVTLVDIWDQCEYIYIS